MHKLLCLLAALFGALPLLWSQEVILHQYQFNTYQFGDDLHEVQERFGTWSEAMPLSYHNWGLLAIVTDENGQTFLLDTAAQRIPVAQHLDELNASHQALYWRLEAKEDFTAWKSKRKLLQNLRYIIIKGCTSFPCSDTAIYFSSIKKLDFSGFKRLEYLSLSGLFLDGLEAQIFNLPKLRGLDLQFTGLSLDKLPKRWAFEASLQHLDWQEPSVTSLPSSLFRCQNLRWLGLAMTRLSSLPPQLAQLKQLHTLALYEPGPLDSLAFEQIARLPALRCLKLHGLVLSRLPKPLVKCKDLEELYLSQNVFVQFPEEILSFTHLKHLDLGLNDLESVSENIGQLQALENLYLDYNRLRALPNGFGQLARLRVLSLGGNAFSDFPMPLLNCGGLTILRLGTNPIREFPTEMRAMKALRLLYFELGEGDPEAMKSNLPNGCYWFGRPQ